MLQGHEIGTVQVLEGGEGGLSEKCHGAPRGGGTCAIGLFLHWLRDLPQTGQIQCLSPRKSFSPIP